MAHSELIGKVSATQRSPTSADEFSFWLRDDIVIAPFDMVAVGNANDSITIGVIREIYHTTDSENHIANYVSHDFGSVDLEATTPRLGTVYAIAEVLYNDKEVYMPVRDGISVRFASETEIRSALGIDNIDESKGHTKIPAGYLMMSNDTTVPIFLDSAFLVGPEGAHLNISGISGLATKTSYAMFLLQGIAQKMKKSSLATIIFNVKGDDLLYIDQANQDLSDSVVKNWQKCGLEPLPFENVKYYFPFKEGAPSKGYANTWCAPEEVVERIKNGSAKNYIYTFDHDAEKIDLLLSTVEDPNFTIDSILSEITSSSAFNAVDDWDELLAHVDAHCQKGQISDKTTPIQSWRRFKRLLGTIVRSSSGLFQNAPSQSPEKAHTFLSDCIEGIKPGDTIVVDIAELAEQEKCLVFGDVIRTIYRMKTEGTQDCPSRVIIFVDELNKYAPDNIRNSPILGDLLEITERGRSLGIILFSAEQFRSAVHSRVKGNCGTNIYGRTNASEIATSDYRYIPKTYANMMTRLNKGNLIIQHPLFRSLMKIAFPLPSYKQQKNK
ncbi:hypothetical protein DSECCO2_534620 [anaerobic digester metagenome]|nr:ATP-binding protein [Candidatus Methanomethylophilaceae archaeon]